ncbi:MAG TPA: GntR family transcriptional regulator [Caldimonas sp.]|nr:GntR family transcriptional regulator [Caldimonas sp.]
MPQAAARLKVIRTAAAAPPRAVRPLPSRGRRRSAADAAPGDTTRRIADAIVAAIVERRLMPGTKLAEQKIADIFKVSRTLVRQALNQLSRDKLVTLAPGRGARVAEPGVEEARQVFEVRRMLEAAMIRRAAVELAPPQLAELRSHLAAEKAAIQRTDVSGRTRLLADFHVTVAAMLGNAVLAGMLGELVSRSSLIALMYQSANSAEHSFEEHVAIVDAIEERDPRTAVKLMESHLHSVERNLHLNPRIPDLESALRPRSSP